MKSECLCKKSTIFINFYNNRKRGHKTVFLNLHEKEQNRNFIETYGPQHTQIYIYIHIQHCFQLAKVYTIQKMRILNLIFDSKIILISNSLGRDSYICLFYSQCYKTCTLDLSLAMLNTQWAFLSVKLITSCPYIH